MKIQSLHPWNVDFEKARQIQLEMSQHLEIRPLKKKIEYVAGADVSFSKGDPRLFAAVVVLKFPELEIVETQWAEEEGHFPYVPGLLSFREIPVLCQAFAKIKTVPDVVICDGHGMAHPRKMGIASHLGPFLNVPTVGCAKSRLVGTYAAVGVQKGQWSPLMYKGEVVGAVLRTKDKVNPVFVSPGFRIDLQGGLDLVLSCLTRYRLPRPTQLAHQIVNKVRKERLLQ